LKEEDPVAPINRKVKIAAISVSSNTCLIVIKVIAGILSGSVSIISEAIHSGMDLVAAIIAFFSVRVSSKPADREHPYGHGKIENVSGVIEAILIFVAAVLIIREAIMKIMTPAEVHETHIGIIVMVISAIVNAFVSSKLYKVAKEEDSMALEADALHLKTDVYTALGVGAGLTLIMITGIEILDPIVAILVALLIIKESWELVRKAFNPLLDVKLSDSEEAIITGVMNEHRGEFIDYHQLRTRKSGAMRYTDFHMNVKSDLTVKESHDLTERIERDIEKVLSNSIINIHIEPADADAKE
jgi:cation diffusion facilitator family transporter